MQVINLDARFSRHFAACDSAVLPGDRLKLYLQNEHIGWVIPDTMRACGLEPMSDAFFVPDPAALEQLIEAMQAKSLFRYRAEKFDVRSAYEAKPLAQVDRGLMPVFGLLSQGVHVNGLVRRTDGLHIWVGKRAANKLIAPGKLDHLVGGGVSSGLDAHATLVKEAGEEAGVPPELATQAIKVGTIDYKMRRPEGVSRDRIHCYDLFLPDSFQPEAVDGEMENFELWSIARALECVRDTDDFKYNVNLVLIDLFVRNGLLP